VGWGMGRTGDGENWGATPRLATLRDAVSAKARL
jgi:hypothetical protein